MPVTEAPPLGVSVGEGVFVPEGVGEGVFVPEGVGVGEGNITPATYSGPAYIVPALVA